MAVTAVTAPTIPMNYVEFRIPKANGGYRTIHAPNPQLKAFQRKILRFLVRMRLSPGPYLHAYIKRRSIRTYAQGLQIHTQKKTRTPGYILKLDVKDFFSSVTRERVLRACSAERLPQWLRDIISGYCFWKDKKGELVLPQGAPTSPFLSNLVMKYVAMRIGGVVKSWNRKKYFITRFSVYCDNLAFAGDSKEITQLRYPSARILKEFGLELNPKKVRLIRPPSRKEACGVVMSEKTSCRREYWRLLRAQIFNAITDIRAGLTPPGFTLPCDARKNIRAQAGIAGKKGFKKSVTGPPGPVTKIALAPVPIPWSEWKGRISFIKMLNLDRGEQLAKMMEELEKLCQTQTAGSTSGSKTGTSSTSPKKSCGGRVKKTSYAPSTPRTRSTPASCLSEPSPWDSASP